MCCMPKEEKERGRDEMSEKDWQRLGKREWITVMVRYHSVKRDNDEVVGGRWLHFCPAIALPRIQTRQI